MREKISKASLLLGILFLFFLPSVWASQSSKVFRELGKKYYSEHNYSKAEHEFNKALLADSSDEAARRYLKKARRKKREMEITQALDRFDYTSGEKTKEALAKRTVEQKVKPEINKKDKSKKTDGLEINGMGQLSLGVEGDDLYGKRANFNLNELNWRILDGTALNNYENTYDPAIYSRLRFNAGDKTEKGLGFYTDIDISPWSFIGKSDEITIPSVNSKDSATFRIKYWSNSRYTLNETVYTNIKGDVFSLPQMKVDDYRNSPETVSGFWHDYKIPETDIHKEFWPLRELSFYYNPDDNFYFEVFPAGLQDKAYTSDDSLGLSNHHIYWEESPWLDSWQEGNYNSGPGDFFQGFWDDSLSFMTRDSNGERLTNLRGFSLSMGSDRADVDFTFASPKTLWQDYDDYTNLEGALRAKYLLSSDWEVGSIYTFKLGYTSGEERDATNQVLGVDLSNTSLPHTKMFFEVAQSRDEKDITTSYTTDKRGNAIRMEIINATLDDLTNKNYDQINPDKESEDFFFKSQLALTHMDSGFEAGLSNYSQTKDDMFWSRHLHFKKPFSYYSTGLFYPSLSWDDIKPFRIGTGVDSGRDTIRYRIKFYNMMNGKVDSLLDIRNVHNTNGKFIENVSRLETTYRVNERLTTKFLGLYQQLPDTVAEEDPFLYDEDNETPYVNKAVEGGKDPSLKTLSVGAKYKVFDWLIPNFAYERTNDVTVAYDNFPRGVYNRTYIGTFSEEGFTSRRQVLQVYNSSFFPQPPYSYFDIFRTGLSVDPMDKIDIYLSWTRNEFEWAQLIDNNSNHFGVELSYFPLEKLGLYFKYTYTKANDIVQSNDEGSIVEDTHHNFFSELRYRVAENSEFIAQYGVGGIIPIGTVTTSPFGGSLQILDTQHIFRAYYRQKF